MRGCGTNHGSTNVPPISYLMSTSWLNTLRDNSFRPLLTDGGVTPSSRSRLSWALLLDTFDGERLRGRVAEPAVDPDELDDRGRRHAFQAVGGLSRGAPRRG